MYIPLILSLLGCKSEKTEYTEKRSTEKNNYKCECKESKDTFYQDKDTRKIWEYDKTFHCVCYWKSEQATDKVPPTYYAPDYMYPKM